MIKLSLILYLLSSFLFSQIVPTTILNKINVENIPNQIPVIGTGETNILFQEYASKEYRES